MGLIELAILALVELFLTKSSRNIRGREVVGILVCIAMKEALFRIYYRQNFSKLLTQFAK